MAHEFTFDGGPLSGCRIEGDLRRYPDKVLVRFDGVQIPGNLEGLEPDIPLTVGAEGIVAEYELDRYETGHFHFVQWSRLRVSEAGDADNPAE